MLVFTNTVLEDLVVNLSPLDVVIGVSRSQSQSLFVGGGGVSAL